MKKASEIRALSDADMAKELEEAARELFNLRMQNATGQLANVDQISKARRSVARVKTIMNEKRAGQ
ncbi:MAG: 50S ribosomal protein L29 [Gammaproteobacteria bacterium]|nr:MAG: 50S ribosomal protein L29 [Gammaproteobacteria bacterium]